MNETLSTLTALPNLHPAVVHFPIALAVVAAAAAVATLVAPRRWLDRTAAALAGLAAAGAWAAWLAGRAAADSVGQLAPAAEATLADHADLALWAAVALTAAAAGWTLAAWRDRTSARPRRGILRLASVALTVLAAGLVARTADLGGALVYRHGVAVAAPTPAPTPSPAPDPARRLERRDDGTLRWRPAPGDGAALGAAVRVLGPPGTIRAVEGEGPGLTLAVDGAAALCLPGEAAGGVVEALVEPLAFRGRLGPAMRLAGPATAVAFELGPEGEAALVRLSGSERKVWDTARVRPRGEPVRLALSVAGRHLKGFVDGQMAVHGHGDPGPPGCAGLVLEGTGTVRLLELVLRPGSAH